MLTTAPSETASTITLDRIPSSLTMERGDGRHILWRETSDEQRIWILPETNPSAPIAAVIPFDMHVAQRVEAVLRLWHRLTDVAVRPVVSPLTEQQRRRMILMLRALDGHQQQATYRDLAATLLDADVRTQSRRDWLTSSYRSQIIRMVKDAVGRMRGGYRDLLIGQ
ncbi:MULTISPECIES: DUF2285 domain-containing protein [unclassified Afipia]|uniref:DUF2285 domain-containing protein n=1 Tax=unclassified Afipia TaxID=2642050 RepID=UPI0004631884|nr:MULTISPECIES: DUF2285 domain-containing protein [unclassified Afipia]TXH80721.1 MAG: DUF2285 domain-containing protein [Rhizobium sp.]